MSPSDAVGILGSGLILGSYALLQSGRLRADRPAWPALNGLGAVFVLLSLLVDFNLAAFVLECAWLVVSLVSLLRTLRRPGPSKTP